MSEYIEREAALRAVHGQRGPCRSPAQNQMLDHLKAAVICIPTADVAPVVRCKDCECWHTTECALDYAMFEPTEFSFCSYGKMKDGADPRGGGGSIGGEKN